MIFNYSFRTRLSFCCSDPVSAIAGSVVSGIGSAIGQNKQNKFAASQAERQQQFELEMANTQYQRGVEDLKAAGLNPMLAVAKPAGMASYTPPAYESPISTVSKAGITNFSALQTARQQEATINNVNSQSKLNDALVAKAAADTTSALATAANTAENTKKTKAGSFTSNLLGTDAATKTSQWLNSAVSTADKALDSIVTNISSSSAKALDRFSPPELRDKDEYNRMYKTPHFHGGLVSMPPAPPTPSYWKGY